MQSNIYTLPELTFVGGNTQDIRFNLKDKKGDWFDLTGCGLNFSMCDYSNKVGIPLLSLTPEIVSEAGSTFPYTVRVKLMPENTVNLFGKYVYQLTIKDVSGKVSIPNQGIMNITRNINEEYITSNN